MIMKLDRTETFVYQWYVFMKRTIAERRSLINKFKLDRLKKDNI